MTSDLVGTVFLFCPDCARECPGEAPPCTDGHGTGCTDCVCLECGSALIIDVPLFARHAA